MECSLAQARGIAATVTDGTAVGRDTATTEGLAIALRYTGTSAGVITVVVIMAVDSMAVQDSTEEAIDN